MNTSKQQLIDFLEDYVLRPAEDHPKTNDIIRRKIHGTRMRLNKLSSAETVEKYFWNAMASEKGIDSYERLHEIDATTFEDVRLEFKKLCGR